MISWREIGRTMIKSTGEEDKPVAALRLRAKALRPTGATFPSRPCFAEAASQRRGGEGISHRFVDEDMMNNVHNVIYATPFTGQLFQHL
jgi:hypothetical protein